jgi:hypothetical protein
MSEPESKDGATEGGESPFRVIDRRRFAADGSERHPEAEDAGSEASEQTPRARPRGEAEAPSRAPASPPAAADPEPELGLPHGEPYGDERSIPIEPTFSTLVMSLSTQALMCLGEIPEVVGQPPRRDLAAAKSVIDLLGVLELKTRGNLDAGEAALFERILYDLRMRFVELSRT